MDFFSLIASREKNEMPTRASWYDVKMASPLSSIWYLVTSKYDSRITEAAIIDWAALFGVPTMLVTDGAAHFDNSLVKLLCGRFKTRHHITTAYVRPMGKRHY